MSDLRRHRLTLWSLVVFVLVLSVPGWYIQMRLTEKVHHLETRVAQLEERLADTDDELPAVMPTASR